VLNLFDRPSILHRRLLCRDRYSHAHLLYTRGRSFKRSAGMNVDFTQLPSAVGIFLAAARKRARLVAGWKGANERSIKI
jgi:hypothetical protein